MSAPPHARTSAARPRPTPARPSIYRSKIPRDLTLKHRPPPAAESEPNPPLRSPIQSVWVASFSTVAMDSFQASSTPIRKLRRAKKWPLIGLTIYRSINSMIESFWSRMQVELLDRQRWRTRIELANAIFDYLEIWHNRQRRHSALGMLSPIVLRRRHLQPWRENPASSLRDSRGTPEPPRIRGDSRATLTQVDTRNKP
jgi:hypothetical protein